MGRALKIQKNNVGSGSTTTGTPPVTTYNQTILTDAGFPPFSSLTDPVYTSPLSASDLLGVVGGAPVISSPSTSYPEIAATVNIALPSGSGQGATTGRIIRQKGSHKYLGRCAQRSHELWP